MFLFPSFGWGVGWAVALGAPPCLGSFPAGGAPRWAGPPPRPRPPVSVSSPLLAARLGVCGSFVFPFVVGFLVGFLRVALASFCRLGRLFSGLGRLFWVLGLRCCVPFFCSFVSWSVAPLRLVPRSRRRCPSSGSSGGLGSSAGLPLPCPGCPSAWVCARRSGSLLRVPTSPPGFAAILGVRGRSLGRWRAPALLRWVCRSARAVLLVVAFSCSYFLNFF